jgi:signal transduction histidine kinase
MKIKYRITLLFTLVVTLLLFILCGAIYYFSDLTRQNTFANRLRNRALSTASILLKVKGINNEMLKRIDQSTFITIQDKSVAVYDDTNREIYAYHDSGAALLTLDPALINKARSQGEYRFTRDGREVIALTYRSRGIPYTVVAAAYDEDGLEKMSQLKIILIISFFAGILITFITGIIFSSSIVAPIQKITQEVKEISSQHLSRRIELHGPRDELHELSRTFNELLTRLEASFQIQRHFIANASHELSTPLTSISSQLEISLQQNRQVDEYREVLHSVYDDVRNLTQLTRGLLEIAKASGTSEGMELVLIRMDELLMKLPSDVRKANAAYQVSLDFDSFPEEEDNLLVFGNPDLLYSAVRNIVINGCKYGNKHQAEVQLGFTDNAIEITVTDDGPGISQDEQSLIFQPFYRSRNTQEVQGFGLGLSLAQHIITLHKGRLRIASEPGQGTRFSVVFPIAKAYYTLKQDTSV